MIKEFQLAPYPRKLFVAINETMSEIRKQFTLDETIVDTSDKELLDGAACITFTVSKDDFAGYLVYILENTNNSYLVHEAVHVVLNLYSEIDANGLDDQEPFAYMVEDVFKKILEVYEEQTSKESTDSFKSNKTGETKNSSVTV